MPGDICSKYDAVNQNLPITLASLAHSDNFVARASTAVDNSVNALDALVIVRVQTGTVAAPKAVLIFAYGSVDGGTTYTGKATGSDAAYGTGNQCVGLLKIIGIIPTNTNSVKYEGGPYSVAAGFGGVLPQNWGVVVQNQSGAALSSSTVDNCIKYQLVRAQYT